MKYRIYRRAVLGRIVASVALLNVSVPGSAMLAIGLPVKEKATETLARREAHEKDLAKRRARSASRAISAKEQRAMQGSTGENPYLAGQNKWDVVYKGLNLMSGNFSLNVTDISFDGGYGIPVNVTRSYSANSADEGPFGKGWTLSADVRSTAGGVLKSGSAPVRSIPIALKERPALEADPNVAVEPPLAVIATDAGGQEETIQKDVDGVLTTPPWDKNTYDSEYEWVTLNGQMFQVLKSNSVRTPEGTIYTYAKKGTYPNGTHPWDQPTATPEAANILKVTTATDRQGNLTQYTYGSTTVTFDKANGTTVENPLIGVSMPGGHTLTFQWGTTGAATGRVTSVWDNNQERVVQYTYTGTAGNGLLASVTTPGGKTTTYGYGSALSAEPVPGGGATGLLTSITDPRGMTTEMAYSISDQTIHSQGVTVRGVICQRIKQPDGKTLYWCGQLNPLPDPDWPSYMGQFSSTGQPFMLEQYWEEWAGGVRLHAGGFFFGFSNGAFCVYESNLLGIGTDFLEDERYNINGFNSSFKAYDLRTQDLLQSREYIDAYASPVVGDLSSVRNLRRTGPGFNTTKTQVDTEYNFLGQPLSQVMREYQSEPYTGFYQTRSTAVDYAYWGKDKYYQQKAVRDQAGRYAFTDYYPETVDAGKRGQQYRLYDAKHAGFGLDTSIAVPAGTDSADVWKYRLKPSSPDAFSAQLDYDAQGRVTDVLKIRDAAVTPWSYVQTHTTYGGNGAPHWGQANMVVEDYGGIGRTTQTLAYTSWGKAKTVQDANGRVFDTAFDADGVVQSVTRTDTNPDQTVLSYTYGTSGLTNGQVTSVADGLSGVVQTIGYTTAGGGKGLPASVTETQNGVTYSVGYAYNAAGDRVSTTYTTPNGIQRWAYADYVPTGSAAAGPTRVFQTLRKLDASGNPTKEEFHYAYDAAGRLRAAAFAQTPATGYTPAAGASWYGTTTSNRPVTRARATYAYDGGGRTMAVAHYWDTYVPFYGNYTSEAILANECDYELTGMKRGLKTASRFYVRDASEPTQFLLERSESYGYEPQRDFLTSANYGDGLPNATPTWTYDSAQNRSDAVCDALNRPTSLGGVATTHDIAGNRLTKGTLGYGWDALNRMTSLSGSVTATYAYRADGMRVAKATGGVTTQYRYDGQMGMETVETQGAAVTVTRHGLGARGVDYLERTNGSGTTAGFPLYDAHGNNVATLTRSGSSFAVNDRRSYDAWGVVRAQQSGGDPKLRYCAKLGHVQDDESGLIYMRARFFEPGTGRFVSQDPARDGANWYIYAHNTPVNGVDTDGRKFDLNDPMTVINLIAGNACFLVGNIMIQMAVVAALNPGSIAEAFQAAALGIALVGAGIFLVDWSPAGKYLASALQLALTKYAADIVRTLVAVKMTSGSVASTAVQKVADRTLLITGLLLGLELGDHYFL
jgi:RHS repeat-associated protein